MREHYSDGDDHRLISTLSEVCRGHETKLRSREYLNTRTLAGSGGQVTGTKNALVPKKHWYKEMVGTKVRLAPKYCLYKRIVGAMKPLVPRSHWYYKITGTNNLLVPQKHLYQEMVGTNA